jgi:hypothetical protein
VPKSERIAEMSWIPEETVNPNEEDMVGEGKAWKRFLHDTNQMSSAVMPGKWR